jgi:hypothetical protein
MPGHLGIPMPMLFYMLVILQMESGLHSSGGGDLDVIIYDYLDVDSYFYGSFQI